MPHSAYHSGTRPGLDIYHTLCVYHYKFVIISTFFFFFDGSLFGFIYIYISALWAAVCANHGQKKRRPSPLQLDSSRPVISSPVLIHAGQFTEGEDDRKFGGFTDIPLEHLGAGEAEEP